MTTNNKTSKSFLKNDISRFAFIFKIVTFSLLFASALDGHGQPPPCGYDTIVDIQKQYDPNFSNKVDSINTVITNYINSQNGGGNSTQSIIPISSSAQYVIPVVVHIVRDILPIHFQLYPIRKLNHRLTL